MDKKEFDKKMSDAYDAEKAHGNITNLNEAYVFKIATTHAFETLNNESGMFEAVTVIDDYLNAGSKADREAIAVKAKKVYEDFSGCEYKNRNDR